MLLPNHSARELPLRCQRLAHALVPRAIQFTWRSIKPSWSRQRFFAGHAACSSPLPPPKPPPPTAGLGSGLSTGA
jgi:hypothetical protein